MIRSGRLSDAFRHKSEVVRTLRDAPEEVPNRKLNSVRRLNRLLGFMSLPTSYLEIGVLRGLTLENVRATTRVGVDPDPKFDTTRLPQNLMFFSETSDEYFSHLDAQERFDLIFLGGLHTHGQTYRDLTNSLAHLSVGGAILIDDTVPSDEISEIPNQAESYQRRRELGLTGMPWHGDVWKVVWILKNRHPELAWRTIKNRGNPQTLVWRLPETPETSEKVLSDAEALEMVDSLRFSDFFADGIPDWMNPGLEDDVLAAFKKSREQ